MRQPFDEFLGAGEPPARTNLVETRVGLGRGDIVADGAAEKVIVLQDNAKTAAQMGKIVGADIDAVDLDQAFVIGMQPLQQSRDRGFA